MEEASARSYNQYIIALPRSGSTGEYSVLGFCIGHPYGRANTASLEPNILLYCPPTCAIVYIYILSSHPGINNTYLSWCTIIESYQYVTYHTKWVLSDPSSPLESDPSKYWLFQRFHANSQLHTNWKFFLNFRMKTFLTFSPSLNFQLKHTSGSCIFAS